MRLAILKPQYLDVTHKPSNTRIFFEASSLRSEGRFSFSATLIKLVSLRSSSVVAAGAVVASAVALACCADDVTGVVSSPCPPPPAGCTVGLR
jgi:hypothetical protein